MKIPIPRIAGLCLLSIGFVSAETTVLTPRILDEPSDGTPAAVQAPKPGLAVPSADVISSHGIQQHGREITIQKIKPITLPEPSAVPLFPDQNTPAIQSRIAELHARQPESEACFFGATVYRLQSSVTRSLFTYQTGIPEQPMISFWSSMDASLLQGISQYEGTDGIIRSFFMAWSIVDTDLIPIPDFAAGPATFTISAGSPTPEALATIQSLHDVYNQSKVQLLAAASSREIARLARENEVTTNSPEPKNIILNHWDIRANSPTEGGVK